METTYRMLNDIIDNHADRMRNLKRYYPFFCLQNTTLHLYKEGRYDMLDMGYITMAVLRFLIEENSFLDRPVTAKSLFTFMVSVWERDFSLILPPQEQKELFDYLFDKLKNDGKPFSMDYFDPVDKKKKTARMKLIDSKFENGTVVYQITADAIEFYLETKEIKEESNINIRQMLLEKMIRMGNFRSGIDIIRRINSEVNKLRLQKKEVLFILSHNVFDGVKALEEFNATGMKWFSEEQKLFEHNMELIRKASEEEGETAGNERKLHELYALETELKRAMANHSELLSDCMELQVKSDEIIHKHKYSRLRNAFDFADFVTEDTKVMPERLSYLCMPLFLPKKSRTFHLSLLENMISAPEEKEDIPEQQKIGQEVMYRFEDEEETERISYNYEAIAKTLFDMLTERKEFTLKDLNKSLEIKFFDGIFRNNDYYSFLVHLCQKKYYNLEEIMKHQDTFFDDIVAQLLRKRKDDKYTHLKFSLSMEEGEQDETQGLLEHVVFGMGEDTCFRTSDIHFTRED